MRHPLQTGFRRSKQGGALLDAVAGTLLVLVAAYSLVQVGLNLPMLLHALHQFIGT
ncbi:MAG: hypothetical protein KGJ23_14650 [Euryarchaeota archaeon]|nr:hypothetical protein [Euryarchaeota archaeon]MDE1837840.1 hypothetical protein [Euryarchaeota archaeon]MDE1880114.1 hypothetical protein [Euryarchaeota archaeon]MDE2046768.1 hypothetical protein [Thermoplasmata archaeon]